MTFSPLEADTETPITRIARKAARKRR